MGQKIVLHFCLVFCVLLSLGTDEVFAKRTDKTAEQLARQYIVSGGFQVGDGTLRYREKERFIPASTFKILTCLLAIKTLGADFRFTTSLYLDQQNNLYIKGGGDPLLTSETVLAICRKLHKHYPQLKTINTIFIDNSFYQLNGWQVSTEHSDNPYDAPNSALAVNFNTLPIAVAADGTISSGEPQTPLLPLMRHRAKQLRLMQGTYRININYGQKKPYNNNSALLYAGQLFAAQLNNCNIAANGRIGKKKVPVKLQPILVYYGEKRLEEICRLLLHYSNNFIANQIFLRIGKEQRSSPHTRSTWEDARLLAASFFYHSLHIAPEALSMVEGSGLSLNNRISCQALITALHAFKPWAKLLPRQGSTLVKSGTMPNFGVFSYAGYFLRKEEYIPYALLLNQQKNTRKQLLQKLSEQIQ